MSVENHKHCQATVLGATGVPHEEGKTWSDIRDLPLTNLEEGWINYFKDNQNITEDLSGILKLINWVAGRIPEVVVQPVTEERRVISEDHEDDIILSGTHDGEILDYQEEFGLTQDVFNMLHPVGSIYLSLDDSAPFQNLDGISSEWTRIAGGQCLWGADDSNQPGDSISAGLPEIEGEFSTVDWGSVELPMGVFKRKRRKGTFLGYITDREFTMGNGSKETPFTNVQKPADWYAADYPEKDDTDNSNGLHDYEVDFKASRSSSPVYGNSNTVQPPAFVVGVWKRTA